MFCDEKNLELVPESTYSGVSLIVIFCQPSLKVKIERLKKYM